MPITIRRSRHTSAATELRAGVSLPVVRTVLGQQHLQTTLRYAETDRRTMQQELVAARRRRGHH